MHEVMLMVLERPNLLSAMRDEALSMRKNVEVLGKDALTSLEQLADEHPGQEVQEVHKGLRLSPEDW